MNTLRYNGYKLDTCCYIFPDCAYWHVPPCLRSNTPVTPKARCHCGACTTYTAVAPPWSPWFCSGSFIDRRSTAENCKKNGDLRCDTVETLNIIKMSAVPPRVGPIRTGVAAAPRWPPWHRTATPLAPPSPPCHRSSTSITAVPAQYNRRAIAKMYTGVSTATPWLFYCG